MTEPRIMLVRYDEIGLKGKNRRYFENCLRDNIRKKLSGVKIDGLRMPRGRIMIETDQSVVGECVERLRLVPGIASLSVGVFVSHDFDAIAEVGIGWIVPRLRDAGTLKFCVRTHRAFKLFPQTSPEINFEVGSRIMRRLSTEGLVVNIKKAEFVLEVEVRQEGAVVFNNRIPGLRGLPVGSSGEVLTLLSGGIDSPAAAHRLICRGC
ncbi:MAG: THUMP domain-containing protein, partial [Nitrospinales bacterium]